MVIDYLPISEKKIHLLETFLNDAGDSLKSFRYFEKRPLSVIRNHKYTVLGFSEDKPIAYGHLDEEEGIIWLGIALLPDYKGKGLGTQMMHHLIEKSKDLDINKIRLSVDNHNTAAINLYKKLQFKPVKVNNSITFFEYSNDSH